MDIEFFREYCLKKPGTEESTPFGPDVLVLKVMGKMFALCSIDQFESINLKCNPETAVELRSAYLAVEPGFHMNKKHWNTVYLDRDMDDKEVLKWIDHSYALVVESLSAKIRALLH